MEGGRLVVYDRQGARMGVAETGCIVGQVVGPVLNPRYKNDDRPDSEVEASLNVAGLTLEQVKQLQGRRVAIFTLEKE